SHVLLLHMKHYTWFTRFTKNSNLEGNQHTQSNLSTLSHVCIIIFKMMEKGANVVHIIAAVDMATFSFSKYYAYVRTIYMCCLFPLATAIFSQIRDSEDQIIYL
ncbi:hypothetical protein ACJX0J_017114, partial [Zea mays]